MLIFDERQKLSLHAKRKNKHHIYFLLFGVPNRGGGGYRNLGNSQKLVRFEKKYGTQ